MTNEQITIMIVGALISSFANVIFEKILGPYIPDKKKISSYIKKFFRFAFMYALPITAIIILMSGSYILSKYSVFGIAFNFFALSINLSNYIHTQSRKTFGTVGDLMTGQWESIREQLSLIKGLSETEKLLNDRINLIEQLLHLKKDVKKPK